MKNIIEDVLNEYADLQMNLSSKTARELIAQRIEQALLQEINIRLAKEDTLPKNWKLWEMDFAGLTEIFAYIMVGLLLLCVTYEVFLGKK